MKSQQSLILQRRDNGENSDKGGNNLYFLGRMTSVGGLGHGRQLWNDPKKTCANARKNATGDTEDRIVDRDLDVVRVTRGGKHDIFDNSTGLMGPFGTKAKCSAWMSSSFMATTWYSVELLNLGQFRAKTTKASKRAHHSASRLA
jgi:hypothetical protein